MYGKIDELLKKYEENKEIGIKTLLTATKRDKYNNMELTVIYAQIMTFYFLANNNPRIINLYEKYKKLNTKEEYANNIDIFCSAGIAYAKEGNNKAAIKCLEEYKRLITAYKNNELKTADLPHRTPSFIDDFELAALTTLVVAYCKSGRDEDALSTYYYRKNIEKPDWDGTLITIGMIVKNEEKTLSECLQALSSLRKTVKCELIVVDTGSIDKTVEIAEKYADEVRHFTWINDFSAARNESLRDAKGDWFMYLDADEIFENTDEIEKFFTTTQHLQYNFASYIVRNYINDTLYSDFTAPRLSRIYPETKFFKSIHESIPMVPPVKYFKDYAHHRGYIGINIQKKNLRNMTSMLKEYRENPDDLSNILQLEQAYVSVDMNLAMEYTLIGLKKSQEIKSLVLEAVFRSDVCYIYYRRNEYQEAYDYAKESIAVFDKTNEFFCVCADIFAVFVIAAQNLKKEYSEIRKIFDRFMEIYEGFKAGTFMTNDMMVKSALFLQLHPSQVVLNAFTLTAIEHGEYKDAKIISLKKDKPSVMLNELNTPYVAQWFTIMRELSDYSNLPELIHDVITSDVDEKVRNYLFQSLLKEISLVKDPDKNRGKLIKIINEGVKAQEKGSFPEDYVLLLTAFDNFYNNGGMTSEEIRDLFADIEKFSLLCADIVLLLAELCIDISIIADKLDYEFINKSPEYIMAYSENSANVITNYTSKTILEKLNSRVQLLLINISIFLLCSLSEEFDFDTDKITNIISTLTACYLESAYTSEVISEENSEHMSLPVRIGFYLFLSRISLADGDIKASVMYLRKLLSFEPRLKEYISRELEKVMGRSPRK